VIWKEAQIVLRKSHNMLISEKATISASADKVWSHLQTLQGAEEYLPIVTKSEVKGSGLGTTRTCDISMGEQKFQIQETLVKLDDSQKSLTISIDDGPPGMKDLKIDFSVNGDNESSEIVVSNEFEHTPESEQMIKGVLNMICTGLKNYHEQ
jgi:carbon monoxide dehydrogenase subunit G